MSITKDFIVKQGLTVQGTATSVSTNTGALLVGGGVGVANSIYAGGVGSFGTILPGTGSTTSNTIQTLRVAGGFGVVGDSSIVGQLAVSSSTYILGTATAVSTNTGALQVQGGLGVGGGAYFGSTIYAIGSQVITTSTLATLAVTAVFAGTDTAVNTNTGYVTVWSTATLASVTGRAGAGYAAGVTPNAITIQNYTPSVSTNSGALIVAGGVGVWNTLTVGGQVNVGNTIVGNANLSIATTASFGSTQNATSITVGAVTIAGGLAVAQTVYSLQNVATSPNASLAATASNAIIVSVGGLGVAGTALIGGVTQVNANATSLNTNSGQSLMVVGGVGVGANLVAGKVITVDNTLATTGGLGSLQVAGGAYIAQNLVVMSGTQSTGTTASNALYVKGGVGIDGTLLVGGNATFAGNVTFSGTATYVFSTNTFYTDNLIELHVPPGGTTGTWTFDDGKDVGLRFHYYNRTLSTDSNAALVLADDSQLLEWYGTGAETSTGTFAASGLANYGGFKTGFIQLMSGTNAVSTITGALTIRSGGIGIGGNAILGGAGQTASSSTVNLQTIIVNTNGIGITGDSYFAGNVGIGGGAGLNVTQNLVVGGGTGSTSTTGVQGIQATAGGIGVTGASYFNGNVGVSGLTYFTNAANASITGGGAVQIYGGASVNQNLYVGGTIYGNLTGVATTASNIQGGSPGAIPYQITTGSTGFIGIGLNGYLLVSNGTSATWQNPITIPVGIALDANNIAVTGTNAAVPYYPAIVSAINPVGYWEPVYSTSTMSIVPSTGVTAFSGTVDSTTSTNGTVVISGGLGVAKSVTIAGTLTNFGPHVILNNTAATTVTNSGALQVAGGAGIQGNLYAGNIYDNNNRVVTSVIPQAGTAISVTAISTSGPQVIFTINNTGVTSLAGTTYLGVSAATGAVTLTNLGVQTLTAGTDTAVSSTTGTITVWNTSTLQSITNRSASTNNAISITNGTQSASTGTGALTVAGGVGIGQSLYLGGTLQRTGNVSSSSWLASGVALVSSTATFTDTSLTGAQGPVAVNALGQPTIAASNSPTFSDAATLYIAGAPVTGTNVSITNPWSILAPAGNVKFGATATSVSTQTGALVVGGGIGAGGAGYFGGLVQAGSAITATPVTGFVSNNATIASYTSSALGSGSTSTAQLLDVWSSSTYRSARYSVQLADTGFTPNRVHYTEIVLLHDGAANVYKSEYGVITNVGELGVFDATVTGNGIQLTFLPNWQTFVPSALTIKAYRTTLSL